MSGMSLSVTLLTLIFILFKMQFHLILYSLQKILNDHYNKKIPCQKAQEGSEAKEIKGNRGLAPGAAGNASANFMTTKSLDNVD